jgi:3-hydroxyethyl bacteriochlorophyllide a dehydrogenase
MTRTATAIVFEAVGRIALRSAPLPPLGANQICARTLYTMVSSGTELRVLAGHYGAKDRYPVVPGYSTVCRVEEVGAEVKGFRVGDLISGRNPVPLPGLGAMWGAQASLHIYATTGEDRPVLLPAGAEPRDYLVAEVAAISHRGVDAAAPRAGETAIVLGQGLIGAFSAAWLAARGVKVIVCDREVSRLERAARWAAGCVRIGDGDHEARMRTLADGGADIVVEASGSSAGAQMALRLLRRKPQNYSSDYKVEPIHFYHQDWPRLVMQANYLEPISIDPFGFVMGEGMTVLAPKDRGVEDRLRVIELLRRGTLRSQDFVQRLAKATEAPAAYAALRDDPAGNFSLAFDWTAV